MTASRILFPIRLRCVIKNIDVSSDVQIREINAEDRLQLLGLKSATLDEHGRIKSYIVETVDSLYTLMGPDLDQYDQLYSSNYVAIVSSLPEAKALTLAFKLLAPSCSALYIGTSIKENSSGYSRSFLRPVCYYGTQPLKLDPEDINALILLFAACRNSDKDRKLSVMADIFLYAMSVAPRNESRCIELSIVLEMLLLPKASTELSYRFALRMAKFAAAHLGESSSDWFSRGKKIYKTRSRLVHSGQDDSLGLTSELIEETTRRLLAAYIRNPSLFTDAALDRLCIAA